MKIVNFFNAVIIVITLLIMTMSFNTSFSGDEATQVKIGNNIIKFYQTFGEDSTALKPEGMNQLQYYGSSFDTFCQFFVKIFKIDEQYKFRHLVNGFIGSLIILFIGLFGRLLKNDSVGIIAMILGFLSPSLLGHSFNNPKDIPFALGYIMSLYFMTKLFLNIDKIDKKTIAFLILSISFTISIRLNGIVLYSYLVLFLFISIISKVGIRHLFKYKRQIYISIIIVVVSYFIGLLLWPFGIVSPFKHPMEALAGFENVAININQLFNGIYTESKSLPIAYLSKYILITTPLLILLGLVLFLMQLFANKVRNKKIIHYLLVFSIFFPILYIMYKNSNVYGGWRHVLFVYPPIVILSSLGIGSLFEMFSSKLPNIKWIFWIILGFSLIHPIRHIITNHPYEYIYFNEVFGGVKNAYGKYELDYYYHSTKEATLWLKNYIRENHPITSDSIKTASNNPDYGYYLKDEDRIKTSYIRFYDRHQSDWDYYICINTHIHPHQLKYKYWPPTGTIHTINVDNKPICAIIKRPSKDDYIGYTLLSKNQFIQAIPLFQNYIKADSTNCSVLASLSNCYIGIGQYKTCLKYANESLKYYKNYPVGLDMIGRVYISAGEYDKAMSTYDLLIEEKPNFYMAYYFQSLIYYQTKNYNSALKKAELCLSHNSDFKPMFNLIGKILLADGNSEEARKYFEKAK